MPKILFMKCVHGGPFAGHFSGDCPYKTLVRSWYWEGMYSDCEKHRKGCPQCCIVMAGGKRGNPHLQPIPVTRPFQILGIDIMDLPCTERGNKHVFGDTGFPYKVALGLPDARPENFMNSSYCCGEHHPYVWCT